MTRWVCKIEEAAHVGVGKRCMRRLPVEAIRGNGGEGARDEADGGGRDGDGSQVKQLLDQQSAKMKPLESLVPLVNKVWDAKWQVQVGPAATDPMHPASPVRWRG